jgi:formylglycine-generating enzyme required for sulfatase activity
MPKKSLVKRSGELHTWQMNAVVNSPDRANRGVLRSILPFGVSVSSLSALSKSPFSPAAPFSPPSGLATGSFNGLHTKSKFLAIPFLLLLCMLPQGCRKAAQTAPRETKDVVLPGGMTMRFCYCPPGQFTMGSPKSEPGHCGDENQVSVTITQGFWMAETEVTQAQWEAVMGSNPSKFKEASLSVEQISWYDAQQMVHKLNELVRTPGFMFAIPTEAQWEYSCRAGTHTAYAFGSQLSKQDANFASGQTVPVKSYRPNGWGLYDMHGNVREWCADWIDKPPQGGVDPKGAPQGVGRVTRGGDCLFDAVACRAAERRGYKPSFQSFNTGFRPALVQSK